jgi:hypothetical protein
MVDTNCNPDEIDYPIPSNDDAIRAIKLVTGRIADAILDGLAAREFAAKEALEAVDVGAFQQTGYVASPDEPTPSYVAEPEEQQPEAAAKPEEPQPEAAAKPEEPQPEAAAKPEEPQPEAAAEPQEPQPEETTEGEAEPPPKSDEQQEQEVASE